MRSLATQPVRGNDSFAKPSHNGESAEQVIWQAKRILVKRGEGVVGNWEPALSFCREYGGCRCVVRERGQKSVVIAWIEWRMSGRKGSETVVAA